MLKQFVSANKWLSNQLVKCGLRGDEGALTKKFKKKIEETVTSLQPGSRILEVGGTSRPLLEKSPSYAYFGLDIDLPSGCENLYDEIYKQSITEPITGKYDLIFSKYLLEHVNDVEKAMEQMASSLNPNGVMIHLFPSGCHPYSLLTRLVGNKMQRKLIRILRPESASTTGYPVFFDKCTPNLFESICTNKGLEAVKIETAWGASSYFSAFVPAFVTICAFNSTMRFFNVRTCASGMLCVARKS